MELYPDPNLNLKWNSDQEVKDKNLKNTVKDPYDDIVWTPFYRTLVDDKAAGCRDEPTFTYTPYILFALSTHLNVWIKNNWNPKIMVTFPTKEKDGKLFVTIVPYEGKNKVQMTSKMISDLKNQIDIITSKPKMSIVLFTSDSFISRERDLIPSQWIKEMLPFVEINEELNPHVLNDMILVELDKVIDFTLIYQELVMNVITLLQDMFEQGYIFNPTDEMIKNWRLIPIDNFEKIYKSNWIDPRITGAYKNIYNFLFSRRDSNDIDFFVGPKWLYRHQVAKSLAEIGHDGVFFDQYIRVVVTDLTTARFVASQIEYSRRTGEGKVLTMAASRESWIRLYMDSAIAMGFKDCVGYQVLDKARPYIFSCKVPFGTDISYTSKQIYDNSLQKAIQLEKQMSPDKLKLLSVHDMIEA